MMRKHPNTKVILAHAVARERLARAGTPLDQNPDVSTTWQAVLYEFGASEGGHGVLRDNITRTDSLRKGQLQPDEYPYYWRVFETNDEYSTITAISRVLEAVRHRAARRRAQEALQWQCAQAEQPVAQPHLRTSFAVDLELCQLIRHGRRRFIGYTGGRARAPGQHVRVAEKMSTGNAEHLTHRQGVDVVEGDFPTWLRERVPSREWITCSQAAIPSVPGR